MNIVKQSTGNVVLTDNSGNILKVFVQVNALDVVSSNEIIVKYGMNQWTTLFADQIDNTQIEPAAAVPFNGNAYDLVSLLSSSFFFELIGGAQNLASVLNIGNSASNQDIVDIDKLDFNIATGDTAGEGQLVWNNTDGTLDLGLKGGAVTLQIGQENIVRVVNKTTPLIDLLEANYQAVVITGATGQRLSVKLARADSDINSAGTIGLVTETIPQNQEGFITTVGLVREINTTGALQGETWADGDILYLSPTVFGGITNVKPIAPQHLVVIGYVEYAHAVHGKIYVKIDNGYELNELHDVAYVSTPTNNQVLTYNQAQTRWENKNFPIEIQAACSDETTPITAGNNKVTFRLPASFTLTEVRASLTTAQASGNIFTVDINLDGISILVTKLTIDNTEKTSVTATTQAVIGNSVMTNDSEITVDVDQIGNATATGLKITLIGFR